MTVKVGVACATTPGGPVTRVHLAMSVGPQAGRARTALVIGPDQRRRAQVPVPVHRRRARGVQLAKRGVDRCSPARGGPGGSTTVTVMSTQPDSQAECLGERIWTAGWAAKKSTGYWL